MATVFPKVIVRPDLWPSIIQHTLLRNHLKDELKKRVLEFTEFLIPKNYYGIYRFVVTWEARMWLLLSSG